MFKGPAHHLLDFCSGLIRTFLPQQVPNKTKEQCHITQSAHAHTLLKRSNDSDTPLNTPMCVSASTIQSTGRVEKKKKALRESNQNLFQAINAHEVRTELCCHLLPGK